MHIIHTLNTGTTPFLRCCVFFFFSNSLKLEKENYSSPDVLHMDEWASAREIRRYQYANGETNRSQNKNDQHQQDSFLPRTTQLNTRVQPTWALIERYRYSAMKLLIASRLCLYSMTLTSVLPCMKPQTVTGSQANIYRKGQSGAN